MVALRRPPSAAAGDFGGTKLSLLLEKQHNRGQDGAGAAILCANPAPGSPPYWIVKSASGTPLADVLGAIGKRNASCNDTATSVDMRCETGDEIATSQVSSLTSSSERIFLGHLRYATFGRNDAAFCHPFVHEASDLAHTLLLAGNFNLTNAHELFDDYAKHGAFPTSKADGYLLCELIARELGRGERPACPRSRETHDPARRLAPSLLAGALSKALAKADGAWTLCGMTGDGWAFATRDLHGIRPGWYYVSDEVVAIASERPAIQAAFDVPPEAVKELPPGQVLVVSPEGDVSFCFSDNRQAAFDSLSDYRSPDVEWPTSSQPLNSSIPQPVWRSCAFERIYFSRANDAGIHRERKALGASLLPQILEAADAPIEDIFFSYIPNSARIAFHGLLEELFQISRPRFGEVIVKDAKFRTFIADAAARREFYKHVYDVTYGLVRPGKDTLVVLDDSIVRGNTMKNAILPMLDRLGPKRIVIASSAPPIRYPDCYGIDMSTLGELVAFKALVKLLGKDAEKELAKSFAQIQQSNNQTIRQFPDPLAPLYARFTETEHAAEIARLLTPPGMKAEVVVVYQTVENLRKCLCGATFDDQRPAPSNLKRKTQNPKLETRNSKLQTLNSKLSIGDWYFTGDYPTPGGYRVLRKALLNYLERKGERSY